MLVGDNLILRPLNLSDLDFLDNIENNTLNWIYGDNKMKYSRDELKTFIKNSSQNILISKQFRYVIDLKNKPIGFIDLFDYLVDSVNLGIIITEEYRRMGYAKEAILLISSYCFNLLSVKRILVKVSKKNNASIKLFISCGFILKNENSDLQYFFKLAKK